MKTSSVVWPTREIVDSRTSLIDIVPLPRTCGGAQSYSVLLVIVLVYAQGRVNVSPSDIRHQDQDPSPSSQSHISLLQSLSEVASTACMIYTSYTRIK